MDHWVVETDLIKLVPRAWLDNSSGQISSDNRGPNSEQKTTNTINLIILLDKQIKVKVSKSEVRYSSTIELAL